MTFTEAKQICKDFQGRLAEVRNEEIDNFVDQMLSNRELRYEIDGDTWWVGARDKDDEGQWLWESDSASAEFQDWASGQPDNGPGLFNNEDCLSIQGYGHILNNDKDYNWADQDCNDSYHYICEKDL